MESKFLMGLELLEVSFFLSKTRLESDGVRFFMS